MNFSYKGKILISTPDISGDLFSRSVVFIVDHTAEGAFGLILNKKNNLMTDKLREIFGFDVPVYEGGPMENDKVFFILRGKPVTSEYSAIDTEFYITEDIESVVTAVVRDDISMSDVKVFSGYSGWAPSQLETEVRARMWTAATVHNLDYTMQNGQNLWKNIMQNLGGEYLLWANAPQDVHLN